MRNEVLYNKLTQLINKFSQADGHYDVCLASLNSLAEDCSSTLEKVLPDILNGLKDVVDEPNEMIEVLDNLVGITNSYDIKQSISAVDILQRLKGKATALPSMSKLTSAIEFLLTLQQETTHVQFLPKNTQETYAGAFLPPAKKIKLSAPKPLPIATEEQDLQDIFDKIDAIEELKEITLEDIFTNKQILKIQEASFNFIPNAQIASLKKLKALLEENKYSIDNENIGNTLAALDNALKTNQDRKYPGDLLDETILSVHKLITGEEGEYAEFKGLNNQFMKVINKTPKNELLPQFLWFEYLMKIERDPIIKKIDKKNAIADILKQNPQLESIINGAEKIEKQDKKQDKKQDSMPKSLQSILNYLKISSISREGINKINSILGIIHALSEKDLQKMLLDNLKDYVADVGADALVSKLEEFYKNINSSFPLSPFPVFQTASGISNSSEQQPEFLDPLTDPVNFLGIAAQCTEEISEVVNIMKNIIDKCGWDDEAKSGLWESVKNAIEQNGKQPLFEVLLDSLDNISAIISPAPRSSPEPQDHYVSKIE